MGRDDVVDILYILRSEALLRVDTHLLQIQKASNALQAIRCLFILWCFVRIIGAIQFLYKKIVTSCFIFCWSIEFY
jgi:hypothetical protein